MNSSLKISVVTVCYNAVNTIEETMLSVLNQSYSNVEYIIIDGGSTDGTVDIIKKYADRLAYWVSESDKGIYDAMNKGIAIATGDYINFMNAGDRFFLPTTIASIFSSLRTEDVIYGDTIKITNSCNYIEHCLPLESMAFILPFGHQSTFIEKNTIKKTPFNLHFKSAADYNQLYHIWENGAKFTYIPTVIAVFDAISGFSAINKEIVIKEVAEINGTINEKNWYFHFKLRIVKNRLKILFKTMLPKSLIIKINRKNIRRNPRFTIHEIP